MLELVKQHSPNTDSSKFGCAFVLWNIHKLSPILENVLDITWRKCQANSLNCDYAEGTVYWYLLVDTQASKLVIWLICLLKWVHYTKIHGLVQIVLIILEACFEKNQAQSNNISTTVEVFMLSYPWAATLDQSCQTNSSKYPYLLITANPRSDFLLVWARLI